MSRRSRRWVLSGLGTVAIGLFAGCSGDNNEDPTETDTAPDATPANGTETTTPGEMAGEAPEEGDPQGITNPTIAWERRYGVETSAKGYTNGNDATYAHGGGTLLIGQTPVTVDGEAKGVGYAVNVAPDGTVRWEQTYENGKAARLETVAPTADGYVAAGYQRDALDEPASGWFLKLDRDGRTQWERTRLDDGFEGQGYRDVTRHGDGYLLSGRGTTGGWTEGDTVVLQVSPGGDIQWSWTTTTDDFRGVYTHVSSDQPLLGGEIDSEASNTERSPWVVALDEGSVAWEQTYDVTDDMNFGGVVDIVTLSDGYLLLVSVTGDRGRRPALIRIDQNGEVRWQETYPGDNKRVPHSLAAPTDDRYYMTAQVDIPTDADNARFNVRLFEVNSNGQVQWSQEYGDDTTSMDPEGLLLRDDGFIVAGEKYDASDERDAMWAVKLE